MKLEVVFARTEAIVISPAVKLTAINNCVWLSLSRLELSDFALRLATLMSPVIGYRDSKKQIRACGNLRTLYLVRERGLELEIPVVLLEKDSITHPDKFAIQTALIALLTQGMDESYVSGALFQMWSELGSTQHRLALSKKFINKTQFAEATSQNRRNFRVRPEVFESQFMAMRETDHG